MQQIPLFKSYVHHTAAQYVNQVLVTTLLSEGEGVKTFESKLTETLGLVNPIAVNSGTSALHLALLLAGIGPGDEVICPAQTFVATALAILYTGATPIFVDIKYDTGNIDPKDIEHRITEKTRALMVVHWGGYPCDMTEIQAIASKYGLAVIEDAAHALGATYQNQPIGSIADFTCFSFQATKHLTTGDGGALCCKDDANYHRALKARWLGIDRANTTPSILGERQFDISTLGYKYHLNDYAAALGLANLETFPQRLAKRQSYAKRYIEALKTTPGITLFNIKTDRQHAYWCFGLHVEKRENFIRALHSKGIHTSVVHQRIDRNSIFGDIREDLPEQSRFSATQINIPLHDGLDDDTVDYIIQTVLAGW